VHVSRSALPGNARSGHAACEARTRSHTCVIAPIARGERRERLWRLQLHQRLERYDVEREMMALSQAGS